MANNQDNDQLLQLQKERTDFFYLWRAGDPQASFYNRRLRQEYLDAMQFPRAGKWPGHVVPTKWPALQRVVKSTRKGPSEYRQRAEENATALDRCLRFADLRIGRILGWGGLGLACEVVGTKANGERLKVVCKVALHDSEKEAMAGEKRSHILTAGARHVVQRVVLEERKPKVPAASGRRGPRTRAPAVGSQNEGQALDVKQVMEDVRSFNRRKLREQLDAREDLLFIEYMRRGDLHGCLGKVGGMGNVTFPNQVLWPIFNCLFRGVVGMAYPNMWHTQREDPEHQKIPQRTELLDDDLWEPNQVDGTLVHFDLDPQNVLIGDYDEAEHSVMPVVKIADLGLCHDVDINFRNDAAGVWTTRKNGKFDIYTPEQFTEEWDFIKEAPISEPDGDKGTAGNYHWWTNMYQVAQVMWQLITLHTIEYPPVAEPYKIDLPDGTVEERWSYGMLLLDREYDNTGIDRDLRELVMLCMSHTPSERPTLAFLNTVFDEKMRRLGHLTAEERKMAQDFCARVWAEPPPPARQPATLGAVAAAQAQAQAQLAGQAPPAAPGPPMSFRNGATQAAFQAGPAGRP